MCITYSVCMIRQREKDKMTHQFQNITVIGCGRWGGFLGYYLAKYKKANVLMYGLPTDPAYQSLVATGCNGYVQMPENVSYTTDLKQALQNDFIVISIGCQGLRGLMKSLNAYDLSHKYFLLAMKGLEESTGKRLTEVFAEETKSQADVSVAVLLGPGHVQDYLKEIPSCVVIDSSDEKAKKEIADFMNSDLIRVYYGVDLIGNEVGGAMKNVIGLTAGILDGLNYAGLKGALMSRATVEVGKIIRYYGGNPQSAYGLAHLGDYEATLFSPHSHNRMFGEQFARGLPFEKLAEGVATLKSTQRLKGELDLPICNALYETIYKHADPKEQINKLFARPNKEEF